MWEHAHGSSRHPSKRLDRRPRRLRPLSIPSTRGPRRPRMDRPRATPDVAVVAGRPIRRGPRGNALLLGRDGAGVLRLLGVRAARLGLGRHMGPSHDGRHRRPVAGSAPQRSARRRHSMVARPRGDLRGRGLGGGRARPPARRRAPCSARPLPCVPANRRWSLPPRVFVRRTRPLRPPRGDEVAPAPERKNTQRPRGGAFRPRAACRPPR